MFKDIHEFQSQIGPRTTAKNILQAPEQGVIIHRNAWCFFGRIPPAGVFSFLGKLPQGVTKVTMRLQHTKVSPGAFSEHTLCDFGEGFDRKREGLFILFGLCGLPEVLAAWG